LRGRFPFVQDGVDLIDDRRFDADFAGAFKGTAGGWDSLGHGFHPAGDVFKALPLAELLAEAAVATVLAEAGGDQISRSAQSLKSAGVPAHRDAKPEEFGQRACDAGILAIAREFGVPAVFFPPGKFRTKLEPEREEELVRLLREAGVELVVLAGFMRVLKAPLLEAFPRRIINLHPSLLPKFPGREAWAQALAANDMVTGCTVHYVDAGVDSGEIIAQREVPILPNDTAASLHARIQVAERELFPAVIGQLAAAKN
jgi:phosphoribosylglycinamide formyltransferase-1